MYNNKEGNRWWKETGKEREGCRYVVERKDWLEREESEWKERRKWWSRIKGEKTFASSFFTTVTTVPAQG